MSKARAFEINSEEDMRKLAQDLSGEIKGGEVLWLTGELGTGKTFFVQQLAEAFGITDKVTSPTFNIALEYEVKGHDSIKKLVHVDLYRLSEEEAASDVSVKDILGFEEEGTVTVIEWADRLGNRKKDGMSLEFAYGADHDERTIKLTRNGS